MVSPGRATDFYGGPRLARHELIEIGQVLLDSPTCCGLVLVAPVHVVAGVVMLVLLLQVSKPSRARSASKLPLPSHRPIETASSTVTNRVNRRRRHGRTIHGPASHPSNPTKQRIDHRSVSLRSEGVGNRLAGDVDKQSLTLGRPCRPSWSTEHFAQSNADVLYRQFPRRGSAAATKR